MLFCGLHIMATVNGSFVSPIADATIFPKVFEPSGLVASVFQGVSVWKALLTMLVGAVVYDQRKLLFFFLSFVALLKVDHNRSYLTT